MFKTFEHVVDRLCETIKNPSANTIQNTIKQ